MPVMHQCVTAGGRSLHFRRLGQGRPVVLLHESPRSSLVLMPLAERLAHDFTVLAIDTPGYGLSDPLEVARPSIGDFADAIAASLRAAGLTSVPVYGTHTGATIAAAMAMRHPDLVTGLVLDGYPVFTRQEKELHEAFYLPAFPPAWDGSHVAALWSRVRDQYMSFPWYLRGQSAALAGQGPGLAHHRAVFADFLRAGDSYAVAYSASFRFDAVATLAALSVPYHILARGSDVLLSHLDRLPPLPEGCSAGPAPPEPGAWAERVGGFLNAMPGDADISPPPFMIEPSADGMLQVMAGQVFVRLYGSSNGGKPPLVLLHDTPGSAALLADTTRRHAATRCVIVPELPGHGISPQFADGNAAAKSLASLLTQTAQTLGGAVADIDGIGCGRHSAKALAAEAPETLRLVPVLGAPVEDAPDPEDPPLSERWDGADLMALWYRARARAWQEMRSDQAGELLAGADIVRVHRAFVAEYLAGGADRAFVESLGL